MPSIIELSQRFQTREQCLKFLEELRFPGGPICPKCKSLRISRIKTIYKFQCLECRHMFSVTSGTIFHRSHIPLQKWILAVCLISNAKKGISAKQIQRDLGVTYKTAWYLMHRIRRAMRETDFLKKFTGIVETDETYVGGKLRRGNRRYGDPRRQGCKSNKVAVLGAKERGGFVYAEPAPNVKAKTIAKFVRSCVSPKARMLIADEFKSYTQLRTDFNLERIEHQYQYVRGQIHTNGIENFWSVLKRGVMGVYHKMLPNYLPLYVSEFTYRYNYRDHDDLFIRILRNGLIHDAALNGKSALRG